MAKKTETKSQSKTFTANLILNLWVETPIEANSLEEALRIAKEVSIHDIVDFRGDIAFIEGEKRVHGVSVDNNSDTVFTAGE